jgi:hypothetical protein
MELQFQSILAGAFEVPRGLSMPVLSDPRTIQPVDQTALSH